MCPVFRITNGFLAYFQIFAMDFFSIVIRYHAVYYRVWEGHLFELVGPKNTLCTLVVSDPLTLRNMNLVP